MSNPGVIVLGPFRSGTSLTCQMLARLGVDFGPASALWRADRYNPGGFLERLDVNHANGLLLESIGLTIAEPVDPVMVREQADRRPLDAVDLGWQQTTGGAPWGIKDPRLCFTLATWVAAGRLDRERIRLVLVSRRHEDVVASMLAYPTLARLLEADGQRARSLVEASERSAAWHAAELGRPVLELDYESMLEDPRRAAGELAAFVGLESSRREHDAAAEVGKRRALVRHYAARLGRRVRRLAG